MAAHTSLPLYVQIGEFLIREIAAGRILEGERLPPERDMAVDLGISVGTLRKALADLTEKGILERRQGSGNYVRSSTGPIGVYAFFRLELIGGGGLPTAEVLAVDRLAKPEGFPDFGPGPDAHRIRRVRLLSGQVAALEEIWLDGRFAGRLEAGDLSESLYYHYCRRLGLWIVRAEDTVGIGRVPDWATARFGLSAGAPCGYVERVSYAQTGDPAEYSRTWFDHGVARYVARLR